MVLGAELGPVTHSDVKFAVARGNCIDQSRTQSSDGRIPMDTPISRSPNSGPPRDQHGLGITRVYGDLARRVEGLSKRVREEPAILLWTFAGFTVIHVHVDPPFVDFATDRYIPLPCATGRSPATYSTRLPPFPTAPSIAPHLEEVEKKFSPSLVHVTPPLVTLKTPLVFATA